MRRISHLLLLAVIIASLHMSAHAGETSSDYDVDYDEEDAARAPGNLAKPSPAAIIPYFNVKSTNVYVEANATEVKIECPVKNYDAKRHSILWYRDEVLVINGNQPIISIYKLDSNPLAFTAPAPNVTGHSFKCEVMPSKTSHQILVKLGSPPTPPSPTTNTNSSASLSIVGVECLFLSLIARLTVAYF